MAPLAKKVPDPSQLLLIYVTISVQFPSAIDMRTSVLTSQLYTSLSAVV